MAEDSKRGAPYERPLFRAAESGALVVQQRLVDKGDHPGLVLLRLCGQSIDVPTVRLEQFHVSFGAVMHDPVPLTFLTDVA